MLHSLVGGPVIALPLTGADLFAWLALRRVNRGSVTKDAGHYLDGGRPVPGFIAEALDALVDSELVVLAEADPHMVGQRRIALTDRGQTHYLALHIQAGHMNRSPSQGAPTAPRS